jgi:hypothetical protein
VFAADVDNNLVGGVFEAIFLLQLFGDGGFQFDYASRGRVFCFACLEGIYGSFFDIVWGVKILNS